MRLTSQLCAAVFSVRKFCLISRLAPHSTRGVSAVSGAASQPRHRPVPRREEPEKVNAALPFPPASSMALSDIGRGIALPRSGHRFRLPS